MWALLRSTITNFLEDEALSRGAAIAFYTVTSLAPVLLIVIAIAGLIFGADAAQGAVVSQLTGLMGRQAAEVLQSAMASASGKSSSVWASVIGIVTLLATASGVFGEMQSALNRIWRAEPKSGAVSRLVRARAASIGLVAALGFLLTASLVVSAGITAMGAALNAYLPFGDLILSVVNFPISLVLLAVLFAAIYKVLPDRAIAWHDVIVGALVTAVLFTIGKSLIGWYLGSSAVGSSYGAAGGLIILLFWIYYSAQIFLVGAEFTKAYAVSRGRGPVVARAPRASGHRHSSTEQLEARLPSPEDPSLTPLQHAERQAAYHREALVRTVGVLQQRLSPANLRREANRIVRQHPLGVAASVGALTACGVALSYLLKIERDPIRRMLRQTRRADW